ncbi:S1C family serine protease [Kurthia senegalensis]|uniref:S1C family serine protease n=1 Tax=Kurthia senegalensis TaxID=1033740 RepID=UPI00028A0D69|nr:S1C family serine protease [Kurthia senegalensis]
MKNKRRYTPKTSIKRIVISAILVLAVAVGIYALVHNNDNEKAAVEDTENIHDVQKAKDEKPATGKVSSKDIEEKGTSEKGASTVTDEREVGPTTTETSPETTNEDETSITMPKENHEAIIANAKTQVYTILAGSKQGSGFLFNTKGDIITNAHVANSMDDVVVINANGQEFNGKVIGTDSKTDVALIRVPELAGKNPLVIDTAQAVVGTEVVAIGSPHAKSGTTTTGKITSVGASFTDGYSYTNLYEITAKLESGSSGGPLINVKTGNVIGINSIILTDHPEIGYALPMANVMPLVNKWAATDPEINFNEHDEEDEYEQQYTFADDKGYEILKAYVEDFYSLIAQDFDYKQRRAYLNFIQQGSAAYKAAPTIFDAYTTSDKSKQNISYSIADITVVEDHANVTVNSVLTYMKDGTEQKLKQTLTFKYIIEYSDYVITDITLNSSTDSNNAPTTNDNNATEEQDEATTNNSSNEEATTEKESTEKPTTEDATEEKKGEDSKAQPQTSEKDQEQPTTENKENTTTNSKEKESTTNSTTDVAPAPTVEKTDEATTSSKE